MKRTGVAVIADLVGSRVQPDRVAAQTDLGVALEEVASTVEAVQPLTPTVGDESQGVYPDVPSALRATLLLRLLLAEPLDCRFGIGVGTYQVVGRSDYGPMQDGPAWWSARDAIVEAKAREVGKHKSLRTWYGVAEGGDTADVPAPALTNAYLLCRDQIVTEMNDRSRRLLLGLLRGSAQVDLAHEEGITQSAVSQNLRRSGAYAVLGGLDLLRGAT